MTDSQTDTATAIPDAPPESVSLEPVDFDWRSPHRFTRPGINALTAMGRQAARRISTALTEMFRSDVLMEMGELQEHYGSSVAEAALQGERYHVPIVLGDERQVGFVIIESAHAAHWVSRLLGSLAMDVTSGRTLSSLELNLLQDIAQKIMEVFTVVFERAGEQHLRADSSLPLREIDLAGDESEAFTELTYRSPEEEDLIVRLAINSDILGEAVGIPVPQRGQDAEQMRQAVLAQLAYVTVSGEAWIGEGDVRVRDLVSLEPGDVLVLDRGANEPIELLVQDKRILSGFPVISSGQYGLQIAGDQTDQELPADG
ncbi:MAG: FliM/FliN family flagellar motor switch protein [Planctomycetota bacterium]|jgi:flagellar motor switch protein FliM